MKTRLHVDNLAATTTAKDLRDLFASYGTVAEANLAVNRSTGRSQGFGFVTMTTLEGARAATRGLNGKAVGGCTLTVSAAWPGEQPTGANGSG